MLKTKENGSEKVGLINRPWAKFVDSLSLGALSHLARLPPMGDKNLLVGGVSQGTTPASMPNLEPDCPQEEECKLC